MVCHGHAHLGLRRLVFPTWTCPVPAARNVLFVLCHGHAHLGLRRLEFPVCPVLVIPQCQSGLDLCVSNDLVLRMLSLRCVASESSYWLSFAPPPGSLESSRIDSIRFHLLRKRRRKHPLVETTIQTRPLSTGRKDGNPASPGPVHRVNFFCPHHSWRQKHICTWCSPCVHCSQGSHVESSRIFRACTWRGTLYTR